MKTNRTEKIIRIIEAAGDIFMKGAAVMFASITLCAIGCLFTGGGIIALMGAAAGALCTWIAWNL
jgi:hypothetical protein